MKKRREEKLLRFPRRAEGNVRGSAKPCARAQDGEERKARGKEESVRRKDREVTDRAVIEEVIKSADCCRLGLCDAGTVYIVPLCFGHECIGGKDIFYFHGAPEGRKISLMKENPVAGFELDGGFSLHEGENACAFSAAYRSVIGTGRVTFLEDKEERRHALDCIMRHYAKGEEWIYSPAATERTAVFRLDVQTLSCKIHE